MKRHPIYTRLHLPEICFKFGTAYNLTVQEVQWRKPHADYASARLKMPPIIMLGTKVQTHIVNCTTESIKTVKETHTACFPPPPPLRPSGTSVTSVTAHLISCILRFLGINIDRISP